MQMFPAEYLSPGRTVPGCEVAPSSNRANERRSGGQTAVSYSVKATWAALLAIPPRATTGQGASLLRGYCGITAGGRPRIGYDDGAHPMRRLTG